MYRILLQRSRNGVNIRQASVRYINSERVVPLRQAGFGKFLLIISPFAIGGGVVQYAKYDKDFRALLVKNVPAIEPVLEVFIDDSNPFADIQKKIDEYRKKIDETTSSITSSVTGLFGGDVKKTDAPAPPKLPPITRGPPQPIAAVKTETAAKSTPVSSVPAPPLAKPAEIKAESPKPTAAVPAPVVAQKQPAPVVKVEIPKNLADLQAALDAAAASAIKEYNNAAGILKNYSDDVKKIVDSAVENIDVNAWATLKNKTMTRDSAVENAEQLALAARKTLNELEQQIDKNVVEMTGDVKTLLKSNISKVNEHLNAAKGELIKAKDMAGSTENYWKKVEKARSYFVNEIESLFGVNLNDKKLDLSKDEIDLFLLNAYSHVVAYQKELQKLQTEGELRLKRAVDAVKGADQSEAIKAQLEYELEKEKRQLSLQNQAKIFRIKAEAEKSLREQLKKQIEAHTDHLNDALSTKEAEMKRKFARELDEKLANERASYNTQLATMLGKLKGMDSALKERADAEKSAHQAQSLWASCQTLWSSLREGQPGKSWRQELRPLKNEIKAVGSSAEGDELVSVVLNTLPEVAKERGVYPEEALRERFVNVDKVARRLALVPAEGASLPVFLLSFVQGALIMQPSEVITQDELEDKEFDFSKLDTYDILNRAKYWMERGNLTQTLRYMNLLQGASRKVSSEWMNEARLLLETQQAVNVLLSHASGNGQRYL